MSELPVPKPYSYTPLVGETVFTCVDTDLPMCESLVEFESAAMVVEHNRKLGYIPLKDHQTQFIPIDEDTKLYRTQLDAIVASYHFDKEYHEGVLSNIEQVGDLLKQEVSAHEARYQGSGQDGCE